MKRTTLLLLTFALLTAAGCGTANMTYVMSLDRHSFLSTPSLPLTFVLRDTIEGKELLRIDIPINKTLVVDLDHDATWIPNQGGAAPATKIHWEIVDSDSFITGLLSNHQDLPGNDVMMKLEVRPRESVALAKTPAYQPTSPGSNQAAAERSAVSGSTKTPVYQPAEPQPKTEPAAAPQAAPSTEQPAQPASSGSGSGGKVNLPVPQGPAVREAPKYQPQEPAQPSQPFEPTKPSEPGNGEDLQKALD
ncbi:MAG: hypothetical protein ACYC26_06010 [Phycisphaerales bacterium]